MKPKKGGKGADILPDSQLPPLPSEPELYSELPSLPEAPETAGLPEIELPPPIKGLDEFELPDLEMTGKEPSGKQAQPPELQKGLLPGMAEKSSAEPLLPNWPGIPGKQKETGLPELPDLPQFSMKDVKEGTTEQEPHIEIPDNVPNVKPFTPEPKREMVSGLVNFGSGFYLNAQDFGIVMDNLDGVVKLQKRHHKLTELKKEENQHYEQANLLFEDIQRKLMFIDRTLFE